MKHCSMLLIAFIILSSISYLNGYQSIRNSLTSSSRRQRLAMSANTVLLPGKNMQAVINGNVICYDLMKAVDGMAGPPIIYLPGKFYYDYE